MSSSPVSDRFESGDPYERYMGRWSRRIAPDFLQWLNVAEDLRWLDVGCGTGALCTAILEGCSPGHVMGVEPSDGFRQTAHNRLAERASILAGNATALPLADNSADVTVSALMLNFVSDPSAALREMMRVTRPDGTIGAYVWDYAEGMQMIRIFWDTVVALDPRSAHLDEAKRFPLCRRDLLGLLFSQTGLSEVSVAPLEIAMRFADFDDFWTPFLGGQGPAPTYVSSLIEPARAHLRERLRERLPVASDDSIQLTARAWMARGTVPV